MKALLLIFILCAAANAQVSFERLVKAQSEPQNWLTYWGDYSAIRHRGLKQINTGNVKDLRMEWMFQTGQPGRFQTMPLVDNGVMYITATGLHGYAIDARTGRELWHYKYPMKEGLKLCCGIVNRGFAMLGDRLFMATPDAHVIALDRRTGALIWNTEMASTEQGYGATLAPLAVNGKVIAGVSGGEFGIRGFVDAYDAETGKRAWRFYTVPAKGEPGGDTWLADSWKRGGVPTWMTGTYDPQLNLLYWAGGNPGPDLYGKDRLGDNLYSASVLALDADTGKLKWYFQFTPHDTHDWDAQETFMLLDLNWRGRERKLLVQANRNAFFYVLDRQTGEFLMGKAFARQTWAKQIDDKGRPVLELGKEPSPEGTRVCPGLAGSANWMAPSYNPETKLFYFNVREQCDVFYTAPPIYIEGKPYWGSVFRGVTDEKEWGLVKALDPLTGATKWDFKLAKAPWAGTLSTSGGLVFAGDEDGYVMALDARSGKEMWHFNTGNALASSPITYAIDGRQYITMPSGGAVLTFALPEK
jgi:alcohol dehydrogenase (cytochrome c)